VGYLAIPLVASAAIGLLLLVIGLRGRRLDDHPICRKCRFDLVGVYLAVERCPECGSALSPRAIRTGRRRQMRSPIALGLLLVLVGAGGGGILGWRWAAAFDWNTLKPVWWLEAELDEARGGPASDAAMRELARRVFNGGLSGPRVDTLAARALAAQADQATAWTTPWGDFLQAVWSNGELDESQVEAFFRNAPTLHVETRPRALAGQKVPLALVNTGSRVGRNSEVVLSFEAPEVSIQDSSGQSSPIHAVGGTMFSLLRPQSSSSRIQIPMPSEPGTYTIMAKYRFGANVPNLPAWERVFTTTVQVVPAGTLVIELLADEGARPEIEAAIKATVALRSPDSRGLRPADLRLEVERAPLPVGFDVFMRYTAPGDSDRTAETAAGQIAAPARQSYGFALDVELPAEFDATSIDIVLRPSPVAAHRSTFVTQIWDGEVVLRDVPVRQAERD
jgi:hypothetical protein